MIAHIVWGDLPVMVAGNLIGISLGLLVWMQGPRAARWVAARARAWWRGEP